MKREELKANFRKAARTGIEAYMFSDEIAFYEAVSDIEFLKIHMPKNPWHVRLREWLQQKKDNFKNKFRGPPGMQGYMGAMGATGAPGRNACEIMCPHCGTWNSEVNDRPNNESESVWHIPSLDPQYEGQPFGTWHCGRCGENSEWFTGAPMLIPAKDVRFAAAQTPKHPTL